MLSTGPQDSAKQQIALTPDSHYRGFQRLGDNVTRYDGGFARVSPVCRCKCTCHITRALLPERPW